MKFSYLIAGIFLFSFHLCFANPEEINCIQKHEDVGEKIKCLKNVTVVSDQTVNSNDREFDLQVTQLVDHHNPDGPTFTQRVVLLHRNVTEPMVLYTSGYLIFGRGQSAITSHFQTNQLLVAHRYFYQALPVPTDWSFLNVEQSADDFHALTVMFKQIYAGPWVNTGTSKGGMTSMYLHYFYPADLAGTVANSAPLSFNDEDARYPEFLNRVGGEAYAACREGLKDVQITLLKNRELVLKSVTGNYTQVGSADIALEHSVIDLSFGFWQANLADDASHGCASVPPVGSSVDMALEFFNDMGGTSSLEDSSLQMFMPYHYQAANQLGAPGSQTSHLETYRKYTYTIGMYIPKGLSISYSNELMRKVDRWSRDEADQVIHIYGEFDPWSAGAFPASETHKNVWKWFVPHGNHDVSFLKLPEAERLQATDILAGWLGKRPVPLKAWQKNQPSLESIEAAHAPSH